MKKLTIIFSFIFMIIVSFAQTVKSDRIDSLGFVYLNMYREYYHLPSFEKNDSFKISCIKWCEKSTLNHTNLNNGSMGEVITGGDHAFLSFRTIEFSTFVKKITKKELSKLKIEDILILDAIFHWEKSPEHKKLLTNKTYTKAYFAISYDVKRFNPTKDLIYSSFAIVQMK